MIREPAKRLPISEVDGAQEMDGEYVSPSGVRFRRVMVWGYVARKFVSEENNYVMLILDDFTGTIPVYLFEELKDVEVDEGDVVRVIGTVRERDGEKRIFATIIKKIDMEGELLQRLENLFTVLESRGNVRVEDVDVL